jgi:hypothetical protein
MVGVWAWSPTVNVETLSLSSSTAHAWSWSGWSSSWKSKYKEYRGKNGKNGWHSKRDGKKGGGHAVPELDPSTAGAAMVLLLGAVAYIASRRRDEEFV